MREVRLREKRKSTDEMVKGSSEVEAYLLRWQREEEVVPVKTMNEEEHKLPLEWGDCRRSA